MSDLVTRAQTVLLARLLHVPVEQAERFEYLGADKLHELREHVSATLFDANADVFKVITALVPMVPLGLFFPIAQMVVPPEMAGRTAGAIAKAHPQKMAKAMALLRPDYAAQAAAHMDPRAILQVAHLAPSVPIVAIANEILRRRDYTTVGLFVDYATDDLIRAIQQGVSDDEGLVRSGAYAYEAQSLSKVVGLILAEDPERLTRMITTTASGGTDVRLAALSVLSRIEPNLIGAVGDIMFGEVDQKIVNAMLRTYVDEGVLGDLLVLVDSLTPFGLDAVASNPVIKEPEFLDAAVQAAIDSPDNSTWRTLIEVGSRADHDVQLAMLDRLLALDPEVIGKVGDILFGDVDQQIVGKLLRTYAAEGALGDLMEFVDTLTPFALDAAAANPAIKETEFLDAAVRAAIDSPDDRVWESLLAVAARADDEVMAGIVARDSSNDRLGRTARA